MDKSILETVWIVVPAYNEGSVIVSVAQEILGVFPNLVIVDDGSTDASGEATDDALGLAREAGAVVLKHPINLGQGAALQTGIEFALRRGAKYIATFDADGQHRIEDVLSMLDMIRSSDLDVVLGSRFIGETIGMSLGRRILLRAAVIFTKLTTGLKLTDAHNGLRLFARSGARKIHLYQNRMAHASEVLEQISKHRLKYAEIGNTVRYTEYSVAKGQRASNAINIVIDLFAGKLNK